jgi:uncharacterized membrane protein
MYPKSRVDALTDGIYAVAMTLLVLDIRLPENFQPRDDADMTHGLLELLPRLWPYVISFFVLGRRWLAGLGDKADSGPVSRSYAKWWLVYMLLVTCVPFATVVMGRYAGFAPAIWLYAGTTLLMALVSWRMTALMPDTHSQALQRERRLSFAGLASASVLAMLWSLWSPSHALLAYLLLAIIPLADNLGKKYAVRSAK